MRYLLDSDWTINLLAGKKGAQDKIQRINPDDIGISLITVAEIYESAYHFANPDAHIEKFRAFLKNFQLVDLNLPLMETFAEVRAGLRRSGQIISDIDIFLAATALHYNLTVLTFNKKHFERIPDLKIYPS
jgi:tRNA(fMet)-specific endonuclease VapC